MTAATAIKRTRKQAGGLTIRDVAHHAGVSTMTVSRVLNGDRNVRDSTRERVSEAIATLNYAPNPAARSLAGADRIRIGLLYSNPSRSYLSELLVGSLEAVSRSNTQLVVEKSESGTGDLHAAERLLAGRVDGVVLPSPPCDSVEIVSLFAAASVPVIGLASSRPAANMLAVGIDDRGAAAEITRHLIAQGHRRIGFIYGDPTHTPTPERERGYLDALEEAGIAPEPALMRPGRYTYRTGMESTEALLSLSEPPTAIFASNDDMAAAAIAVAHRHKLDVPGDLSVVGFDDTPLATAIWPELTTIRQPIGAMAQAGVDLLIEYIRARRAGEQPPFIRRRFAHELVRRESDGPPRG